MPSVNRTCVHKSRLRTAIMSLWAATQVAACSLPEEVKRIEAVRRAELEHQAATSTNLNGEQIFVRSCNTCHPGGDKGLGPSLVKINQHFADDAALTAFIRRGKGTMPAQGKEALNDQELASLIAYLRALAGRLAAEKTQ